MIGASMVGRIVSRVLGHRPDTAREVRALAKSARIDFQGEGILRPIGTLPQPKSRDQRAVLPVLTIFDRSGGMWDTGSVAFSPALGGEDPRSGLWEPLGPGVLGESFADMFPDVGERSKAQSVHSPLRKQRPTILFGRKSVTVLGSS